MSKIRKIVVFILSITLIALSLSSTALANSAARPNLTVVVSFPPDDLTLSIRCVNGDTYFLNLLSARKKAWEAYYRFFVQSSLDGATLVVQSSSKSFECPLSESAFRYSGLLTLNLADESISEGHTLARSILLVFMRLFLTVIIEGFVFFGFGYRKKASWIAFFVINIITQGILNIALSGTDTDYEYFWIFIFVFYEILITITETIAFALILKEHERGRAVSYAVFANVLSLVLGGFLIASLPV